MHSSLSSMSRHADVIVVGAGVLGTFHAYFAAQKGYKTLLLERNPFPTDASTRNFGMVVQSIVEAEGEWASFAQASREIYYAIQQEHDISVKVTGSLYLASTEIERTVLEEFAHSYALLYHCSYLSAEEACYRYPFVQPSYCRAALFFPDDFTLEPRQMLRRLQPYLVQKGLIEYIPRTTIITVESVGQHCRVIDAAGNIFTAHHVFVCSGAEYRVLFPELFKASGLRICKLQMMQTIAQERILPHSILSGLSILRYPAFKATPSYPLLQQQAVDERLRKYGIHLLFKQAANGAIIIGDSHEYSDFQDASSTEEYTHWDINQAILEYGKRMLSLPSWNIEKMWNGYYLLHPQQEVYTQTIENTIHIATGIAGKGMSTGPGFARKHIDSVLA